MNVRGAASNGTRIALACFVLIGFTGLRQNLRLARERRALRAELAILRGETPPDSADSETKTTTEIVRLTRKIAEEDALGQIAMAKEAAAKKLIPAVEGEELRSFGGVEKLGYEAAAILPQFVEFMTRMNNGTMNQLTDEEQSRFESLMIPWMNKLEVIGGLEEKAAEIARFHAASLQQSLALDAATTNQVRAQAEREFQQLKEQNLARNQRPETDQDAWYERRKQALDEASARIEAVIPASQRRPYAVGRSLYLGTGMRSSSSVAPNGQRSVTMTFELPGVLIKL